MFLKEIKSVVSGEHRNDKKKNSLINDMDTVLVVWAEEQVNHGISLETSALVQIKALTDLNAIKAERG